MKRIWIFFAFLISLTHLQAQELTRILFIFDASNSMNGKWEGATKIVRAREILSEAITDLKGIPNLELALRVYGHQSPVTPDYQDCNDTKLEIPFEKNNHNKIINFIKYVEPKGTTPIARSLEAAADDFPDKNTRNVIILITDGLEACDGFPCAVAKKLKDKGVNVTPFVVGLGIDLSYLDNFSCIGRYYEASTLNAFKKVMESILSDVLFKTSVQIDLNDINYKETETNTTVFFYEAGTKNLKYTFMHTMNRKGNPDTLTIINPDLKYDVVVNTLPQVIVKNVTIKKGIHNHIDAYCPQGSLIVKIKGPTKTAQVKVIVRQDNIAYTLNVQEMKEIQKYIVGTYDVEVLTLPRIYFNDVQIKQSDYKYLIIPGSGLLYYKASKYFVGQVFVKNQDDTYEWVCDLDTDKTKGQLYLQPGQYKIVYRQKDAVSTDYTQEKKFMIMSGENTSINL
ncbi:MAG TPA: VWA domain-containing protein [Crocinitomix sp.]|nr:VWA domain-containing protein [Crocinitomix sp.]